ncbi:MAG: Crp/Fnr family transcriptional regulator [Pseudohongiella sp.]|uniref:Crp/Fnr family transcriptional regulator n=1 Tax=Pseudohongiella sp. TaxID=1979412 RepID=UPI0034A0AC57
MSANNSTPLLNRLLDVLSADVREQVLDECKLVNLKFGDVLCELGKKSAHVYFPLNCLVSLVIIIDDHAPFELAMISRDGMLGASEALGVGEAPQRAVVQGAGEAIQMPVQLFKDVLQEQAHFQSAVKRYLFELMTQINRTAGCSQFHRVNSRLARWLLLTNDRSGSRSFALTQQYLSEILGVQRSAVSIAASDMQNKQLISYTRGVITILDRAGLVAEACSCYDVIAGGTRSL